MTPTIYRELFDLLVNAGLVIADKTAEWKVIDSLSIDRDITVLNSATVYEERRYVEQRITLYGEKGECHASMTMVIYPSLDCAECVHYIDPMRKEETLVAPGNSVGRATAQEKAQAFFKHMAGIAA